MELDYNDVILLSGKDRINAIGFFFFFCIIGV